MLWLYYTTLFDHIQPLLTTILIFFYFFWQNFEHFNHLCFQNSTKTLVLEQTFEKSQKKQPLPLK